MKKVITTSVFRKHFKERIAKDEALVEAFRDPLFTLRNEEAQAKTHPLTGVMAGVRSRKLGCSDPR
jgi:mRNA-degrading endonuclease YafQ of YafQ-DinJ toxin-antitoxin module